MLVIYTYSISVEGASVAQCIKHWFADLVVLGLIPTSAKM